MRLAREQQLVAVGGGLPGRADRDEAVRAGSRLDDHRLVPCPREAVGERAIGTLRALPGGVVVSTASRLPLSPDINMDGIRVPGHHSAEEQETPVDTVAVGPDYFATVNIPIVSGRAFTREDAVQGLARQVKRARLLEREQRAERELDDQGRPARSAG